MTDQHSPTAAEAAVFRRLISHLQNRTDVQNIDLMLLADFCRNCLSKWYLEAANEQGMNLTLDDAREHVYGMSYAEWKDKHQLPVPDKKLAAFEAQQAAKEAK